MRSRYDIGMSWDQNGGVQINGLTPSRVNKVVHSTEAKVEILDVNSDGNGVGSFTISESSPQVWHEIRLMDPGEKRDARIGFFY